MNNQAYAAGKRQQDRQEQFRNSYRVVSNGIVVTETPARLGEDFARRMCEYFVGYVKSALHDLNWVFDGCGGKKSGTEWLRWQEERLGAKLSDDVRIVPPGEVLPLCPDLRDRR